MHDAVILSAGEALVNDLINANPNIIDEMPEIRSENMRRDRVVPTDKLPADIDSHRGSGERTGNAADTPDRHESAKASGTGSGR